MNHRRHDGDHDQHDRRQRVDAQRPIDVECSRADPGEKFYHDQLAALRPETDADEHEYRERRLRSAAPRTVTICAGRSPITRQKRPAIAAGKPAAGGR
jgi:hypothetical protein